jgi:hypothetical protein
LALRAAKPTLRPVPTAITDPFCPRPKYAKDLTNVAERQRNQKALHEAENRKYKVSLPSPLSPNTV